MSDSEYLLSFGVFHVSVQSAPEHLQVKVHPCSPSTRQMCSVSHWKHRVWKWETELLNWHVLSLYFVHYHQSVALAHHLQSVMQII